MFKHGKCFTLCPVVFLATLAMQYLTLLPYGHVLCNNSDHIAYALLVISLREKGTHQGLISYNIILNYSNKLFKVLSNIRHYKFVYKSN